MTKLNKTRIHVAQWDPFEKRLINQTKETYEIGYLMDLIDEDSGLLRTVLECYDIYDVVVCIADALGINHQRFLFGRDIYKAIKEKLAHEEAPQRIEDDTFCLTINGTPITSGRIRTEDNVVLKVMERVLATVVLKQYNQLPEHKEALSLLRDISSGAMEIISSRYPDDLED